MASLVEADPAPGSWAEALERQPEGLAGAVLRKALVRREPSLSSAAVGELRRGTALRVTRAASAGGRERLLVAGGGLEGWVSAPTLRKPPRGLKVGLCFLVYGGVEYADVWRWYLDGVEPRRFAIYAHSKRPGACAASCGGLRNVTVLTEGLVDTQWGDVSLVKAAAALFRAARDGGCDAFVLLSDTMLPLEPFDALCDRLGSSLFQVQERPSPEEFEARSGNHAMISRKLPRALADRWKPSTITKANMFCALLRDDFDALDERPQYDAFSTIWVGASDEYYWANMMTILRRPYASARFLYCAANHAGVTAAELHDVDGALLAATRGFLFVRKVRSIAADALPRYLQRIRSGRAHVRPSPAECAAVATTASLITGHVWGEVE